MTPALVDVVGVVWLGLLPGLITAGWVVGLTTLIHLAGKKTLELLRRN